MKQLLFIILAGLVMVWLGITPDMVFSAIYEIVIIPIWPYFYPFMVFVQTLRENHPIIYILVLPMAFCLLLAEGASTHDNRSNEGTISEENDTQASTEASEGSTDTSTESITG